MTLTGRTIFPLRLGAFDNVVSVGGVDTAAFDSDIDTSTPSSLLVDDEAMD